MTIVIRMIVGVPVLAVKAIRLAGGVAQHSLWRRRASGIRRRVRNKLGICDVVVGVGIVVDVVVARRLLVLLRRWAPTTTRLVVGHVDRYPYKKESRLYCNPATDQGGKKKREENSGSTSGE